MKFFPQLSKKSKRSRINGSEHLLVRGNSSTILKKFKDESVDLIFTDPPYNAGLNYGGHYQDRLPWGKYFDLAKKWFAEYPRILKKTGSVYLMNYPEINARLLPYLEDELGLKFRRWITWHYPTNIGHSKKNFTRSQRSILFLTKSNTYTFNRSNILQPYKNPNVGKIKELLAKGAKGRSAYDSLSIIDLLEMQLNQKARTDSDLHEVNLLKNVSVGRLDQKHPCQLPLDLIKRFVLVSSNKGDTVLDPFAGTFSTSVVAASLARNSVGIEINPDYIDLGLERFADYGSSRK